MLKRTLALLQIPVYPVFLLCMLLQGMAISISGPFLAVYFTEELGVSAGTFGIFTAVTLLSGVALSMFIARRSDAGLNRRRLMVVCMTFNAVAFAGYIFIHSFYPLLVYMTVFTALGAPAMPQLFASAREAVNASRSADHAMANSTLRSMFSLGFISGPLAGAALLRSFGFQGVFLTTTLIFLVNALLVYSFVRPAAAKQQSRKPAAPPVRLHRDGRVLVPFLIVTLLYTGHWANSLNISLFIVNTLGGTTQDVASVSSICALLEIPFMFMLGGLSARYGSRRLMGWGMVLGEAIMRWCLAWVSSGSSWPDRCCWHFCRCDLGHWYQLYSGPAAGSARLCLDAVHQCHHDWPAGWKSGGRSRSPVGWLPLFLPALRDSGRLFTGTAAVATPFAGREDDDSARLLTQ